MLASTVQFSTYDQSPPTCPRRTRHTHRRHSGTRTRWPCQRRNGCPLSQDPTACLRPRTPRDPCSTRHRGDAVLGTDRSRRPNWSAFHPRAPSRTPAATR
jgi:hypothetical protein